MAVRQVAAVREVHAEHGVAGLQQRQVDAHVGLRAGVRLHVDVIGAEQLLGARDRQRLRDVHEFAAAVIALAGIALGVLVRHHRAGGFEHRGADEVFRRDQLEPFFLPPRFVRRSRRRCRDRPGQACVIEWRDSCGIHILTHKGLGVQGVQGAWQIRVRFVYNHMVMKDVELLNATFAALADPTRRAILARLASG